MNFLSEIDLFKFMERFFYAEALSDILDARGYRKLKAGKSTQKAWDKYGIM